MALAHDFRHSVDFMLQILLKFQRDRTRRETYEAARDRD